MNKNFDEEYKKYISEDTPDLWNRIESSLHDKKKESMITEKQRQSDRKKVIVLKYSGFIAAAVCLAIIIPAYLLNRDSKTNSSHNDDRMMAEVAYDTYDTTEADYSTEMFATTSSEDTGCDDSVEEGTVCDSDGFMNAAEDEGDTLISAESTDQEVIMISVTVTKMVEEGMYECTTEDIDAVTTSIYIISEVQILEQGVNYTVELAYTSDMYKDLNIYQLITIE